MWGLAIWDRSRSTVFCSRDRLGVKPLYYSRADDGSFAFASEIKGLLAFSNREAKPNERHIARFLRTTLVDDTEETCFEGIDQLLPAHCMEVSVGEGGASGFRTWRYWNFDPEYSRQTYDYSDPSATLRTLLEDSIRLRLNADVPVGTCLSGGLDSSSIVAIASAQLDHPVWTFSSLYSQAGYDESMFVRLVNETFQTDAHEVYPSPGRLKDILPRLTWHQEQPNSSPGVFSQWHVMEMASEGVTVLLDGQGADELLGGYTPYFVDYLRSRAQWTFSRPTPARLWRLIADAAVVIPTKIGIKGIRAAMQTLGSRRRPEVREEYLASCGVETASVPRPEHLLGDRLSDKLVRDTFAVILPGLLRYEDRNSMAFSLEARTPFLDYRIVEFCLALPFDQRIRGQWTKFALRKAVEPILPKDITWRRDKMGYPTPLAEWLRRIGISTACGPVSHR